MNTDIRIDWQPGMEITPQTFIDMENNIAENRLLIRKMVAAKNFGVIPRTKFSIIHEIYGNKLTIKQMTCSLLLPTGAVAVVETNQNITVEIPQKDAHELYLTLNVTNTVSSFSKGNIHYLANENKLELKKLSEITADMPLMKIVNENDTWNASNSYVMPVMASRQSPALIERLDSIKKEAKKIAEHDHAPYLVDNVLIMMLVDQLVSFSLDDSSRELVLLCKRIATALSYAVFKHKSELPAPNIMDVEPYLIAFNTFISETVEAMDNLKPIVFETKEEEKEPEPPVEEVFYPII